MTARLLDGRQLAARLLSQVAAGVAEFDAQHGFSPRLAIVTVGDDPASHSYAAALRRAAGRAGIGCELLHLPASTTEASLRHEVRQLNERNGVHGIVVQMPLPAHLSPADVSGVLAPEKDVDGVAVASVGLLALGDTQRAFAPSTPLGGMRLLEEHGVAVRGMDAVVVGRSRVVGRPMAAMLLAQDATVTTCHRQTRDLAQHTRRADLVVLAAGVPGLLKAEMVKPGACVVDFGTTRVDGRLVGDADFEAVSQVAGWITPVPGGTGPMTVAVLLENTLRATQAQAAARVATPDDDPL